MPITRPLWQLPGRLAERLASIKFIVECRSDGPLGAAIAEAES